jgi:TolA-binding protein
MWSDILKKVGLLEEYIKYEIYVNKNNIQFFENVTEEQFKEKAKQVSKEEFELRLSKLPKSHTHVADDLPPLDINSEDFDNDPRVVRAKTYSAVSASLRYSYDELQEEILRHKEDIKRTKEIAEQNRQSEQKRKEREEYENHPDRLVEAKEREAKEKRAFENHLRAKTAKRKPTKRKGQRRRY